MNWWTVPGSRTGWVLRDRSNPTGTQPPDFPFTLDSQPRPRGFSKQQGLDRAEREWAQAEMERAREEQESERKMQREGWGRRWEPCSPFRYRRDCKRSMSDSSQRELEAWASRYCHSLPRKRRMEAGMWGAQGFHRGQTPETERFPQWVGRGASADFQGTYPPPTQNPPMSGWRQEEIRQSAIPFRPPQSSFLKGSLDQVLKENDLSYQQSVSSQPPSYNYPPPYSAPHYSPFVTQQPRKYDMKDTVSCVKPILAQPHAQEGTYSTYVASVKQEVDVRAQQQGEEAWAEEWNNRKELDLHCGERHSDNKKRDGSPPPPKPLLDSTNQAPSYGQPEITTELKEQTPPEANKSVKTRLKKKRVRETIFCLVSRLGGVAGLSSSPEDPLQSISLPLSNVPSMTGTAGSGAGVLMSEGSGQGSTGFQIADEIDSKVTDHHQFSSPSTAPPLQTPLPKMDSSPRPQAAQTWTESEQEAANREELFQAFQIGPRYQTRRTNCQSFANAEDTVGSKTRGPEASAAPEMSKRVQQPHGSVKFPLWKEPSLVAQINTNPAPECIKGSWEQQGGAAEDLSHDQDESSNASCGYSTEESMLEHKKAGTSDGSSGIFIIDATCVVVRAEFISPPKKELVQYSSGVQSLNTGPLNDNEIIKNHPGVTSQQELDALSQDSLLQENREETEGEFDKQELQSQEPDGEQNLTLLHGSPSETDVSHTISKIEGEEKSECPDPSLPNLVIPANETLEERAVRILGIPLLGSSVEETNSKEPHPDSALHYNFEMQQSFSDPPSVEQGSDTTHETGQDEDQNYLPDIDTAEDNQLLDGDNTPGMGTEVRSSQVEESKSMQPSMHESFEEDEADTRAEIKDNILQEIDSEERVSSYLEFNQDASSHSEGIVHHLPSPSENLCLTATYFDSPPTSPSLMFPLSFSLPLSGSPTNDLLQEPSPLSHTASCCSLSGSASYTCSSRAHSPLCPVCPSSHPLDSTSLAHVLSPPLSPFVPHSPSNSSPPFDFISNSEHQSPETPVETLPTPQSLSPLQTKEPQYPKSLWDAVYRIRRHTAPDSENEEEEGGELWDNPENVSEDGELKEAQIDLVHKRDMDRGTVETAPRSDEVLDEDSIDNSASHGDQPVQITAHGGRADTVTQDTKLLGEKVGEQEGRQGEEELGGQIDDDTLSCGSSDSHASRDTVIMGKEDAGQNGRGVEIWEGVEDNGMRVGTEANQIVLSCKDGICNSSGKLLGAEVTGSYRTELCPTKQCFGDGDEMVLAGETDNKHTVEPKLMKDEDGEFVSPISGQGEIGDPVCPSSLEHNNVREGEHECVPVEIIKSVECCSDTNKTKGNQDIGLVAENTDVNEDVRYEKICIETKACRMPEGKKKGGRH